MTLTFVPFIIRFERRKVAGRELVILAVLAAIAAVSRVPFASIPSVQPTTFVIIVTGIAFGAESGFVVGALAALVSNLFLGQGPWTPWQMYAWGMIGLVAGFLRNTWLIKKSFGRIIFGFFSGILFGWVMNLWYFVSLGDQVKFAEIIAYYGASMYFDLAHALSNVFFLIVFANSWIKILQRFRKKYGLLDG
ncbi:ECF transporter S component [Metabacillus sp. KUDC1714]|uniref:ECF transporter S component n=2 Tax=Bacillaceae TaxID=186817 RepID=A0ABX6SA20_9BACI|nr:ECF transporter S component [Metabacillus sp. KUDC1714]